MGVNFYYTQYLKRSFEPSMWLFLLYYHLVPLIFIIALNKIVHKNALPFYTCHISINIFISYDAYKRFNITTYLFC